MWRCKRARCCVQKVPICKLRTETMIKWSNSHLWNESFLYPGAPSMSNGENAKVGVCSTSPYLMFFLETRCPFPPSVYLLGEYVSSHCRKMSDPLDFCILLKSSAREASETSSLCSLAEDLLPLFKESNRKDEAIQYTLDWSRNVSLCTSPCAP
jgi:hypothetical protein